MKTNEHSTARRILPKLPQVFGAASGVLGLITLLAWLLNLPVLASFGADLIPMAPSTALLFVFLGLAVVFHTRHPQSRRTHLIALGLCFLSAAAALLLFWLSSAGIYTTIEHIGVSASGTIHGSPVGHMSPITAFCFFVLALSIIVTLFSSAEKPRRAQLAFLLACVVGLISVVLMVAYSFGTPLMYGSEFIPPALPTSLAFFFLAIAVLTSARPHIWPTSRMDEAGAVLSAYFLGLIFVLLTAGILAIGYSYYHSFEQRYTKRIDDQISSVADLKVGELVQWRKERLGDAFVFFRNANFSGLVREFLDKSKDIKVQERLRTWMRQVRESHTYSRVCLHDATLTKRMSYPEGLEPPDSLFTQPASEALQSGKVMFQDFYRDGHDGRIYLNLLIPILDPQQSERAIAILSLRIDPETYLYPLLKRWPFPSRTAETLIARRQGTDALILNDLRFGGHTALNLRIPLTNTTNPVVRAALGQEGTAEGVDYRAVPVLANVRTIPDSPWFMVARMDLSEIQAPLRERLWMTVILIGALLVSAGAGVGVAWKQQRGRFYRQRYEAAQEIQKLNAELEQRVIERTAQLENVNTELRNSRAELQSLFESLPGLYLVLTPELTIVAASDAYLMSTLTTREGIIGRNLFEVFPDNPDDPDTTAVANMRASISRVLQNAVPDVMGISKHDVRGPDGVFVERYWSPINSPMFGADRQIKYIVHRVEEVTEFVLQKSRPAGTSVDVSARMEQMEAEIFQSSQKVKAANQLLEAANKELEAFSYSVSHDLRAPLRAIDGFSRIILEEYANTLDAEGRRLFNVIRENTLRMSELIDDLLALSRVGRSQLRLARVNLTRLALSVCEEVVPPSEREGGKLTVSELPDAHADEALIRQVWANLISNAWKFSRTQERREISIGGRIDGIENVYFVKDNGVGFDETYKDKLFGVFQRLHTSSQFEGTGVGLAIVKRIVGRHGGRVWAESTLNDGATFYFTLPN